MTSWNLIVGMDFSEYGERAFRTAVKLGLGRKDAAIHIAHAIAPGEMTLGKTVEKQAEAMGHAPRQIWDRVVRVLESEGVSLDAIPIWQHVRLGEAADVIRQVAVDYDGAMVIVGTHGLSGVKRMVLGSVADELVRDGRFPVLVAHANHLSELPKTVGPDAPLTPEQKEARAAAGDSGERHVYRSNLIDAWKELGRPTSPTRIV